MNVKLREGSFPALDATLPLVTAHWSGVLIIIFSERQDELVSLMKKGDKKCGAHCIWYCIVLFPLSAVVLCMDDDSQAPH